MSTHLHHHAHRPRWRRLAGLAATVALSIGGSVALAAPATAAPTAPDGSIVIGDLSYSLDGASQTATVTAFGAQRFNADVVIPDTVGNQGFDYTVTAIGDGAFERAQIASLQLPDSLETIGDNAFHGNALTGVVIPPNVASIGKRAFAGTDTLDSVRFTGPAPSVSPRSAMVGQQYYGSFPRDRVFVVEYPLMFDASYGLTGSYHVAMQGGFSTWEGYQTGPTYCQPFPDVFQGQGPNSMPCAAIQWLKYLGITKGTQHGTYQPGASLSRGQMAAFFYRYTHNNATAPGCTSKPYDDVPVSNVFCGAITWFKGQHITQGYAGGTEFGPADRVSRGQMAAFLYRFDHGGRQAPASLCTGKPFGDVSTNSTFCSAITWMHDKGIATGTPPVGNFRPTDELDRAPMAKFMFRLARA